MNYTPKKLEKLLECNSVYFSLLTLFTHSSEWRQIVTFKELINLGFSIENFAG